MRERIRVDAARNLDLTLRDQRARHRRTEEVLPIVDGARPERWEDEVADELLPQILDVALLSARGERLLTHATQLSGALTDVGGDADHPCVVVLAKPGNDDRGVEPPGIRKDDGARHGNS